MSFYPLTDGAAEKYAAYQFDTHDKIIILNSPQQTEDLTIGNATSTKIQALKTEPRRFFVQAIDQRSQKTFRRPIARHVQTAQPIHVHERQEFRQSGVAEVVPAQIQRFHVAEFPNRTPVVRFFENFFGEVQKRQVQLFEVQMPGYGGHVLQTFVADEVLAQIQAVQLGQDVHRGVGEHVREISDFFGVQVGAAQVQLGEVFQRL